MKASAFARRVGRSIAVLALVAAGFLARPSRADDTIELAERARVQFALGLELYEQGDFEQAAVAFETANKLNPSYKILFNIAQTENELKHYARAIEAYRGYLAGGGSGISAERSDQVQKEIARLEPLVGEIALIGGAKGAVVLVDGERRGTTPVESSIVVDLGDHEVVVKRGATEMHRERVRVGGGMRVRLELGEEQEPVGPVDVDVDVDEDGDGGGRRVWTWVALGVGAAAGIGAGVTGGLAISKADDLESSCPDEICGAGQRDTLDSARSLAMATDVLIGVAAVGVAAAVVLFFVEPGLSAGDEDGAVVAGPLLGPDTVGWTVGGRF
jgi:hypothetical protein